LSDRTSTKEKEMIMRRLGAVALLLVTLAACSTGGLIGGVAGGYAGHELGKGSTAATIGGAAVGAVVGDQIQKAM
jgi:osmotically inducible lipoprotein OsmB